MRRGVLLFLLGSCALPGVPEIADYDQTEIEIESLSPVIPGDGRPVYAASGPVIVGGSLSKDGGVSWATPAPIIMLASAQAIDPLEFVVATTQFGLARWNMQADFVQGISQPFSPHGAFGASATTGSIVITSPTTANVARHGRDFVWTPSTLAMPVGATAPQPAPTSVVSNGSVYVMTTSWGVYRSTNDGGSFALTVPERYAQAVVLTDNRFLLIAADRTGVILDASGQATGITTPAFPGVATAPKVACLGAVLDGSQLTRDLGVTWEPFVPGFDVSTATCAGDALLATVAPTGQLSPTFTLRFPALGAAAKALPVTSLANATDLRRSARGTLFVNHLAWRAGEELWEFRPLPARTHLLANGDLLAFTATDVLRSTTDGATWTSTPRAAGSTSLDFTSVVGGPTLYGAAGGSLHRSSDAGVTWTPIASTMTGLDVVALTADGTLVARTADTGVYVSTDGGASFRGEPFPREYRLTAVTTAGIGVTFELGDPYPEFRGDGAWHLWADYGTGLAFKQVTPTIDGTPVRVGDAGERIALDADDHLYMTGGGVPFVFRSTTPLE